MTACKTGKRALSKVSGCYKRLPPSPHWSVDDRHRLYPDQKPRIRERRHSHPGRGRCGVTGKELPKCAPDGRRLVGLVRHNANPQRHHILKGTAARLDNVTQIEENLHGLASKARATNELLVRIQR